MALLRFAHGILADLIFMTLSNELLVTSFLLVPSGG